MIFEIIFVISLIAFIILKIVDFIDSLFPDMPEWTNKHGAEYIKWKEEKGI